MENGRHILGAEPWWFWLWTIWGMLCAAIIGAADRSMLAGAAWLAGSAVIACFGMRMLELGMRLLLFDSSPRLPPATKHLGNVGAEPNAPFVAMMLDFAEQPLVTWRIVPGLATLLGTTWGVLAGGFMGALAPIVDPVSLTSLQSALIGIAIGPLVVAPLVGVGMLICILREERPCSLDPVRPLLLHAGASAEIRGQPLYAGHVLIELLLHERAPLPEMEELKRLDRAKLGGRALADVPSSLPNDDTYAMDQFDRLIEVLHQAQHKARRRDEECVSTLDLLEALLDCWPPSEDILADCGVNIVALRHELRAARLRAPPASA
jgi:hypothetical protein